MARTEGFEIIDDTQHPLICVSCGTQLPEHHEMKFCDRCMPGNTISVSPHVRAIYSYDIEDSGMIWSGLPDDPEPECDLKDLPIYKRHPDKELYRRFPWSAFSQQMNLINRYMQPGETVQYDCFICGREHSHPDRRPRDPSGLDGGSSGSDSDDDGGDNDDGRNYQPPNDQTTGQHDHALPPNDAGADDQRQQHDDGHKQPGAGADKQANSSHAAQAPLTDGGSASVEESQGDVDSAGNAKQTAHGSRHARGGTERQPPSQPPQEENQDTDGDVRADDGVFHEDSDFAQMEQPGVQNFDDGDDSSSDDEIDSSRAHMLKMAQGSGQGAAGVKRERQDTEDREGEGSGGDPDDDNDDGSPAQRRKV